MYTMTKEEAFKKAHEYASAGIPQAVLRKGRGFEEVHTSIPPDTLMEWLLQADEFWIVRTTGSVSGPFTDALAWIEDKDPIMGFERWQGTRPLCAQTLWK